MAVSKHWQYRRRRRPGVRRRRHGRLQREADFKFLYPNELPLRKRVEMIAKEVYGADGVDFAPEAAAKAERFEKDPKFNEYATMMVKTHLSLTADPTKKGTPKGWRLPVRDFLHLLRRQVHLPGLRRHFPHARHRFRPGLPPRRRRRQDRQSHRPVLKRYHSFPSGPSGAWKTHAGSRSLGSRLFYVAGPYQNLPLYFLITCNP